MHRTAVSTTLRQGARPTGVGCHAQKGLDADIMFLWDDVFEEPLRDRLNASSATVGNRQQEALMLLQVRRRCRRHRYLDVRCCVGYLNA